MNYVFYHIAALHSRDLDKVWIVTRTVNGVQTIECRKSANKGCVYGYALKDRLDSAWDLEKMSSNKAHLQPAKIVSKCGKHNSESTDMKVSNLECGVFANQTLYFRLYLVNQMLSVCTLQSLRKKEHLELRTGWN